MKLIIHPCWVGLLALCLAACGESSSAVYGTVERDRLTLTAPSTELIADIQVQEGDRVSAGTVLLRLDSRAADARLAQAMANLAQAEARLAELTKGARDEELARAEARLAGARATLSEARAQYDRTVRLVAEKVLTAADLDKAVAGKDRAQADVDSASQALKELIAGTRSEQLSQASAAVDAAQAQVALEQKLTADLTLVAARDAVVDLLPWRVGDRVSQGSQLVGLLAQDAPYVRVYLPASALDRLLPGAEVGVRVDGRPVPVMGKVRNIRSEPAFTPFYALNERDRARLMYLADIDLPVDAGLATGLVVEVLLPEVSHD